MNTNKPGATTAVARGRRRPKRGRTIILLGISGSGKGTQASLLSGHLRGSVNISTGDSFRRMAKKKNLLGRFLAAILKEGDLVPYWGPAYVWLTRFFERLKGDEDVILDGAPRRIEEARMLDDFMHDLGRPLPIAIYLELPPAAARQRLLKRGRADDNRRAILERFRFFKAYVRPVVGYYRRHGRLITVNGGQAASAVWRDIKRALRRL